MTCPPGLFPFLELGYGTERGPYGQEALHGSIVTTDHTVRSTIAYLHQWSSNRQSQPHPNFGCGYIDGGRSEVALNDLRALLTDVSSVKEALQENIREISIPRTGAALLEPRPEGLLNRVFLLVTPRGHAPYPTA